MYENKQGRCLNKHTSKGSSFDSALQCMHRSSDVFGFMGTCPQASLTCGLNICKPNLSLFLKTLWYCCLFTISFSLFSSSCPHYSKYVF